MMYPTPFATATDVVDLAIEVEQLGYYEVAGNDHITTQAYVREAFSTPPDFFEPLVTYSHIAALTSTLRLVTGILVFPMREPVLLAKQLATLDQLSDGRIIVGAGVGAYREEFTALHPQYTTVNRGRLLDESIQAVRSLFEERRATFSGDYVRFNDIEMYPKPRQDPLPIYAAGNADNSLRRAAQFGQGWLPAGLNASRIEQDRATLHRYQREYGRASEKLAIAPQLTVCLADTQEAAEEQFRQSQLFEHLVSLSQSTMKNVDTNSHVLSNLIGTPDVVCDRIARLEAAGVTHLCGIYFVANDFQGMRSQIKRFARDILPSFAKEGDD
jgi:probable F420-dependent oxidoreductase